MGVEVGALGHVEDDAAGETDHLEEFVYSRTEDVGEGGWQDFLVA